MKEIALIPADRPSAAVSESAAAGTPPSLEDLFDQFGSALLGFVRQRTSNPSLAEDLTQEIWLKVHERLPTLRDSGKLESWLYRIARNTLIDYARRSRPAEELPDNLATDNPEPDLPDLRPAILRFLDQLPADDREALRLTEYEGLTQKQLAEHLGVSLSGAKSRVQRARARLGRLLDQCCRFEFDRRGRVIEAIPHPASTSCTSCR
jgi:RNA polymerase sigma-70 factor (ECF subfamily)